MGGSSVALAVARGQVGGEIGNRGRSAISKNAHELRKNGFAVDRWKFAECGETFWVERKQFRDACPGAMKSRGKLLHLDGFAQVIIHSCGEALLTSLLQGVRGHGDDPSVAMRCF